MRHVFLLEYAHSTTREKGIESSYWAIAAPSRSGRDKKKIRTMLPELTHFSLGGFSTLIDASEYGRDHDRNNPEAVKISLYKG